MNCKEIDSQSLLAYANILENLNNTSLEIARECSQAVSEGFATKEEVESFYNKALKAKEEADNAYLEIQKELDLRMKKQLGISFGIRKIQVLIKDFDAFVSKKSREHEEVREPELAIVKDDSNDSVQ